MFAIGSTRAEVVNGKVALPPAYRLKKKPILAKWKNENILYLSDSDKSLDYAAGKDSEMLVINVDTEDRIIVPERLESSKVDISGCISSIELIFKQ